MTDRLVLDTDKAQGWIKCQLSNLGQQMKRIKLVLLSEESGELIHSMVNKKQCQMQEKIGIFLGVLVYAV